METFSGFPPGKVKTTPLPAQFFGELLALIDDLAEFKVTLFCFWALHQKEGDFRYLRRRDFVNAPALMQGLAAIDPDAEAKALLDAAIDRAVTRETLLCAEVTLDTGQERLYFMNTPRGQEAIRQLQKADGWRPGDVDNPVDILPERPTIYGLYEANIGPLTPLIAEELQDAEKEYSYEWVVEGIKLAVEMNKRNWRYIMAILERWHKEGKNREITDGHHQQSDGKQYVTGRFSDFIES
jgi:DNA replication protein